jgi:hypothetical protein
VSKAVAVVIDVTLGVILLETNHMVTAAATVVVAAASAVRCKGSVYSALQHLMGE